MTKNINIASLLFLMISTVLPLTTLATKHQPQQQHPKRQITQTQSDKLIKPQRVVAKFQSNTQNSKKNSFTQLQNQIATSNLNISLSDKAAFNFNMKFANYNKSDQKNSEFNLLTKKNERSHTISVGVGMLPAITVKISEPGQKWAELRFNIVQSLDLTKVIPTSITFSIVAAGSLSNAKIWLDRQYELRTQPDKIIIDHYGSFGVYNSTQSMKKFFATKIGTALAWTLFTIAWIGAISAMFGSVFLYRRFKKKALLEATDLFTKEAEIPNPNYLNIEGQIKKSTYDIVANKVNSEALQVSMLADELKFLKKVKVEKEIAVTSKVTASETDSAILDELSANRDELSAKLPEVEARATNMSSQEIQTMERSGENQINDLKIKRRGNQLKINAIKANKGITDAQLTLITERDIEYRVVGAQIAKNQTTIETLEKELQSSKQELAELEHRSPPAIGAVT